MRNCFGLGAKARGKCQDDKGAEEAPEISTTVAVLDAAAAAAAAATGHAGVRPRCEHAGRPPGVRYCLLCAEDVYLCVVALCTRCCLPLRALCVVVHKVQVPSPSKMEEYYSPGKRQMGGQALHRLQRSANW